MNTHKSRLLSYIAEKFARDFVWSLLAQQDLYKKAGINLKEVVPSPFRKPENLVANITYLENVDYLIFQFVTANKSGGNYWSEANDPLLESFIEKKDNKKSVEGILYQVLNFKGIQSMMDPDSFLLYFSFDQFLLRRQEPNLLAAEIVRANVSYQSNFLHFQSNNNNYGRKPSKEDYISSLNNIADEFYKLIFDINTPELKIDKFLEKNNIILREGLKLDKFIHQSVLHIIEGDQKHDLKPDLIAYNLEDKKWVIVDYKKSNKNVVKNLERTRTGLTSEVHSLKDQLRDYKEYFEEHVHRKKFKENYSIEIKNPATIGIIGVVNGTERDQFNRVMEDEPRWYKVVPYNYLHDNFLYYINTLEKFV